MCLVYTEDVFINLFLLFLFYYAYYGLWVADADA